MSPTLGFRVESLGPIRHGEIKLHPLTLLIGKNNTGKTYMAQVIHAAHETVRAPMTPSLAPRLSETEVATLQSIVLADQPPQGISLPEFVGAKAPTWILKLLRHSSEQFVEALRAYCNVTRIEDLNTWKQESRTQVEIREYDTKSSLFVFGISDQQPEVNESRIQLDDPAVRRLYFSLHWILTHYDPSSLDQSVAETERRRDMMLSLSTDAVTGALWQTYLDSLGFCTRSRYLPSGRSGIMAAATDVIRSRLQNHQLPSAGGRMSDVSLGSVHGDFLSSLQFLLGPNGIVGHENADDESMTLALECVNEAMSGAVDIRASTGDMSQLVYEQSGNTLPLNRASAMVTDLAPLSLWLQRLVRSGDLLIIDEPESHLHPEAIRLVARALVRLVNAGVNVLCTTHSNVLLHQISNCMLVANVPDGCGDLTPEDGIASEKIGVFRFRQESDDSGVTIVPVEIETDWGIPEDEYVDNAEHLINQTAALIEARQT
ncbi:MAG: AAA family ATPase [bacterium]|nr:AAA family ATPase [bacterium]